MKKQRCYVLPILLGSIVVFIGILPMCVFGYCFIYGSFHDDPYVTTAEIKVENYTPSISNGVTEWYNEPRMIYCDGALYICYPSTPGWNNYWPWEELAIKTFGTYKSYSRSLIRIENGKLTTIGDTGEIDYLYGSYDKYIYYLDGRAGENGYRNAVCAYNTETNTVCEIMIHEGNLSYRYDFTDEGVLRIAEGYDEMVVYHIKEDQLLGCFPAELSSSTVQLGEDTYYSKRTELYCNDDKITEGIPSDIRSGFFNPVGDGVVYTTKTKKGFDCCYIDSSGEIIPLLPEMEYDYLEGNVCVYDDYIFISFRRVKYGIFETQGLYKNDDISGVYRIDTRDFSSVKISDQYCNSMQIFDDTGIYVTQYEGVYKMDFDGNLLLTIIER